MSAIIIAVEGIDGAGKNTLVTAVEKQLSAAGVTVARMGFPAYGQTIFADLADDALHGKLGDVPESAWAMALLFALDRWQRREAIVESMDTHDVVILDRYVASNAAYSWARTGDEGIVRWIEEKEFGEYDMPRPDVQVYLGTPVEVAAKRAQLREGVDESRTRDVYERDSSLQERTAAAYVELSNREWGSPWHISDGDPQKLLKLINSICDNR
ncbi:MULTISPECIES: dTMP kinase [unclassified Corynebacterium]|uniref:dTMP kinase n=1 Tax=unclassified Corynebacterium TaxID=2624378 RepID=UPI00309DED0D